jgi:hypothetical protein
MEVRADAAQKQPETPTAHTQPKSSQKEGRTMRGIKVLVVGLAAVTLVSVSALAQQLCPNFDPGEAINLGIPLADIYLVDQGVPPGGDQALNDLAGVLLTRRAPGAISQRVGDVPAIINNVDGEFKRRGNRAVDVVIGARGAPGSFTIGGQVVGNDNKNEQDLIKGLQGKIKSLWIIACSVAQGNAGGAFLQRLAQGLAVGAKQVVAVSGPTGDLAVQNNNLFCSPKTCDYAVKGANPIPSLTEWGLIALAVLLAGSLAFMIRRRLAPRPAGA